MAKNKTTDNQVETIDEVIKEDVLLTGVVTNCFRLNIRKEPDKTADIVTVVDLLTHLKIDEKKSTDNWYYVLDSNGTSGYCMKQYVSIKC